MKFTERESLIAISTVCSLTAKRAHQLVEYFGSARELWQSSVKAWPQFGISDVIKNEFTAAQRELSHQKFFDRLKSLQATVVTITDEEYPESLKEIYDPPLALYVRGNLKQHQRLLAVIGSRKRTRYGQNVVHKLLPALVEKDVGIISGMAFGIDSDAHKCTLANDGYTIAVLGNGIDKPYPASNKHLMQKIIATGAVVSEYPPGFKARKWTFPARNRIIAGLSEAVLIIEAGEKSGSAITADFAIEQGKDVLAVPGSINNSMSIGTNKLIQQGARLVISAKDIIEELDIVDSTGVYNQRTIAMFSNNEKLVLSQLSSEPVHVDTIVQKTSLAVSDVLTVLTMLALDGIVQEYHGKVFSLIKKVHLE